MGKIHLGTVGIGLAINGGFMFLIYIICAFSAILGGHIAGKRYQESRKKFDEIQNRLDATESRLQALIEKYEGDGKNDRMGR